VFVKVTGIGWCDITGNNEWAMKKRGIITRIWEDVFHG
jgi:hypothetical protein